MKILSLLLCVTVLFTPRPVLSEEDRFLITGIEKGQKAPFTGILLTQESLSKIESDLKLKTTLCEEKCSLKLEEQGLAFQRDISLLGSENDGLSQILSVKNKRIEDLEKIVEDVNSSWALPITAISSFILGVGITVGITYAVNK